MESAGALTPGAGNRLNTMAESKLADALMIPDPMKRKITTIENPGNVLWSKGLDR